MRRLIKFDLIKLSCIVSSPLISTANIVTLGDLRSMNEEQLLGIKLGIKTFIK